MFFRSKDLSFCNDALLEHIDGLYRYAMALSQNRSNAEDLVQETYVRAIPAAERLRKGSNVKGWLFTILRNVWLNQLRNSRNYVQRSGADIDQFLSESVETKADDAYSLLVTTMEQERVRTAIRQLPAESREVILLREYEGLSYRDIAGVLNCPIGTVMSRLGRARLRLGVILRC